MTRWVVRPRVDVQIKLNNSRKCCYWPVFGMPRLDLIDVRIPELFIIIVRLLIIAKFMSV